MQSKHFFFISIGALFLATGALAGDHDAALSALVGAAAATGRAEAPVIQLTTNSLNDLFACNDLLDTITHPELEAKLDLKQPGNGNQFWRKNTYSPHPDLLTYYNDKRGFFMRFGNETYFIPRPSDKAGVILFGHPIYVAAGPVDHSYPQNNHELSLQHFAGEDYLGKVESLQPVLVSNRDEQALAGLRSRLNLKIGELGKNLKRMVTLPNQEGTYPEGWLGDGPRLDAYEVRDAERFLAKQKSPEDILMKLNACRMAMAPEDAPVRQLISELNGMKDLWRGNIQLAKQLQTEHIEYGKRLANIRRKFPVVPSGNK